MWGSLSRGRRATVKRTALVLVIAVGISVAVDKYNKEAATNREVLPWHQGGYMDHHGDLELEVVPGGKFAGARLEGLRDASARSDASAGDGEGERGGGWRDANGTIPERERDREGVDDASPRDSDGEGEGGSLGNDDASVERLAVNHA